MNKITLMGFVGQDPETKHIGDSQVTKFSLATTERYKNKSGEKVEDTTWHSVEAWGKQAEIISQYVKKGSQLLVIGQQRNEKHDDKYYSKVRMQEFEFVGSSTSSNSNVGNAPSQNIPDSVDNQYDDLPF